MNKSPELRQALVHIKEAQKKLAEALVESKVSDINTIFANNPVFMEGLPQDPNERDELFATDRYLHFTNLLSSTVQTLVEAQERMMRLGIHLIPPPREVGRGTKEKEVRLGLGKEVSRVMEKTVNSNSCDSTSISPDS